MQDLLNNNKGQHYNAQLKIMLLHLTICAYELPALQTPMVQRLTGTK